MTVEGRPDKDQYKLTSDEIGDLLRVRRQPDTPDRLIFEGPSETTLTPKTTFVQRLRRGLGRLLGRRGF